MKKTFFLLAALAALLPGGLRAQSSDGFSTGFIILADGTRLDGNIKEQFKAKAAIQFQPATGKKTTYSAGALNEVVIGSTRYISYANDFFKVSHEGAKASLLQKVSDATGKVIYNGSEAAGISSGTEGKPGDFFIRKKGDNQMHLLSKLTLNTTAATLFADCTTLADAAKAGKLDITDLENIVARYNGCN